MEAWPCGVMASLRGQLRPPPLGASVGLGTKRSLMGRVSMPVLCNSPSQALLQTPHTSESFVCLTFWWVGNWNSAR